MFMELSGFELVVQMKIRIEMDVNQVAFLTEKVNRFENLEERLTQLIQLVQN